MRNSEVDAWQLIVDAAEVNQVEIIRSELGGLLAVLHDVPRFLEILKSPAVRIDQKKEWVEATFSGHISAVLMNFLIRLIKEERFDSLAEVEKLYDQTVSQYLEEYANIVEGKVYSATPLLSLQLEQLEHLFTEKMGKQVKLTEVIDASLIGGYKVEIKSQMYDNTIGLQLQQLKESLQKVDLA